MKANNILKTLFTCSVQEYNLGAHSSKSVVQRENLVKKIRSDNEREESEGGSKASKVVARLLVTKFRDKYFSYSQSPIRGSRYQRRMKAPTYLWQRVVRKFV